MESTNVSDEVLNLMPGAVALFRADESIFCANEAMQDMYDCQSQREFFELTGASFRGMVLPEHYESIAMMVEKAMQHGSALQGGLPVSYSYLSFCICTKTGRFRSVEGSIRRVCHRGVWLWSLLLVDVYARFLAVERDALTNLMGRHLFFPRCRSARKLTALKASTAGTRWRTSI